MYNTGFVSIPHVTVTAGHFKKLQEAEGYCKDQRENRELHLSNSIQYWFSTICTFIIKITLNRELQIGNTHM